MYQLIDCFSLSHYLQGFLHARCWISSINSTIKPRSSNLSVRRGFWIEEDQASDRSEKFGKPPLRHPNHSHISRDPYDHGSGTVDGWNADKEFIPWFTRFQKHPMWLGMGFLNHQQYESSMGHGGGGPTIEGQKFPLELGWIWIRLSASLTWLPSHWGWHHGAHGLEVSKLRQDSIAWKNVWKKVNQKYILPNGDGERWWVIVIYHTGN